jgi:hypothetical protein
MVKFQDLEEQAADEGFGDAQMSDGAMKQYRSDFDCEQQMESAKNTLGMILVAPGAVAADGKSPLAKLAQVSRQMVADACSNLASSRTERSSTSSIQSQDLQDAELDLQAITYPRSHHPILLGGAPRVERSRLQCTSSFF